MGHPTVRRMSAPSTKPDTRIVSCGYLSGFFRAPAVHVQLAPALVSKYGIGQQLQLLGRGCAHGIPDDARSAVAPPSRQNAGRYRRGDRNLNTGAPISSGEKMKRARQSVYHDPQRLSRIVLPIMPQPLRTE